MERSSEVTIILLGESDVGKTSLLLRFVENKFRDSQPRTIVNKHEKVIQIEGNLVKLTVWDTAGRKEYKEFVKNYYNIADGVLLIYDTQNSNKLSELSKWLNDFKSVNKNAEILIAGNKSEDEIKDSKNFADVENFVRTENIDWMKVSAKFNKNVNILFYHIVQKVLVAKEILKSSKYSQLIELEKSKSFISSNSISPKTVNASSTVNVRSTTETFVSCVKPTEWTTSSTINKSTRPKPLDSCEESVKQSNSYAINTSSTTESLLNCAKLLEKNTSSTIKTSRTPETLIRGLESVKKNVANASTTAINTESSLNTTASIEQNTINTPSMRGSLTTCLESTKQHPNTLESASNIKANGKLTPSEICEVENDADQSWEVYDNSSNSIGHSIFYSPPYHSQQSRILDQDSDSVDSAESAEEFFESTRDSCSRDKFTD